MSLIDWLVIAVILLITHHQVIALLAFEHLLTALPPTAVSISILDIG